MLRQYPIADCQLPIANWPLAKEASRKIANRQSPIDMCYIVAARSLFRDEPTVAETRINLKLKKDGAEDDW